MGKEIILTSENLVYEDIEIGSSSYSDGTLQYSSHAQMHWSNSVYASPANDEIEGAIEIPSEITIEGKKRKVIGILSFKGCCKMTSVFLPKSIMEIRGDGLFSGCDSLESIIVEEGNYLYESRDNCNAIIYKYNNANVLLAGCNNSTIPNGITKIREMAFEDCRNLTKITIPDSVRIIGRWAFSGCSSLKSIFIPDSVKEIGEGAFSFCSDIESIEVAKGNKIYDSRNGCNAIIETASNKLICGCKNTDIPDSVSAIGENAFSISSLHEIAIPESVTEIGGGAFAGDKSLKHIKMSSFILSIGDEAFSNSGLVSIDIPKSVTFINNSALYSCQKLERIRVDKENPVYDSRNDCNAIIETASNKLICGCKNTIIPESVTVIGEAAFAEHDEITSVVIPEGIVEIEPSAFRECKNLTSVYSHVKDPDACFVHISVFIEHGDNAVLYVPKGTVEAYRKAQGGWRLFRDIREFDSDK